MPNVINPEQFNLEQSSRVVSYYNSNKQKLSGFVTKQRFIDWYLHELYFHENKCHYCETSILEIRMLLNANLVSGRRVRGAGMRGANLEVDRKDPFGEYNEVNCVLSCYYCNNDKSNTFDYEVYKHIIGPAKKSAWLELLRRLNLNL
jgi:hypothetical protein